MKVIVRGKNVAITDAIEDKLLKLTYSTSTSSWDKMWRLRF